MRARGMELAAVLGVVLMGACRKGPAPEPVGSAPPVADAAGAPPAVAAPAPAQVGAATPDRLPPAAMPILTVRVGTGLSAESGVESGQSVFRPGEDVLAAVDVSVLPPGAVVKASWYDGNGGGRGEEQKPVAAGMRWLTFTAPGAHNWGEGSYRIDVSVSTGGVASAGFQIAVPTAEQPANEPG